MIARAVQEHLPHLCSCAVDKDVNRVVLASHQSLQHRSKQSARELMHRITNEPKHEGSREAQHHAELDYLFECDSDVHGH